uniref:Putative secreted protein n=1 Tax=Rhipicephalus microplus TaxID=6941 RepID=A0A6M2DD03_RHIMP
MFCFFFFFFCELRQGLYCSLHLFIYSSYKLRKLHMSCQIFITVSRATVSDVSAQAYTKRVNITALYKLRKAIPSWTSSHRSLDSHP